MRKFGTKTWAVLNQKTKGGEIVAYPIEKMLYSLAKMKGCYVLALLDCCSILKKSSKLLNQKAHFRMKDKKVILLGLPGSGKTLLRMFMFDGCVVPEP